VISKKIVVQLITSFCAKNGLTSWVLSPGSRNAPFTLTIANDSRFDNVSIVDERSAGFIALGKSLITKKATVLSCTSGTAALNYSSAIAEAYYQKVPLLVITSDRPQHWIGHGEGQSIKQIGVYDNFVKSSYHLNDTDTEGQIVAILNSVNNDLTNGIPGPIHLNVSFEEPLYSAEEQSSVEWRGSPVEATDADVDFSAQVSQWTDFKRIMILCGQREVDPALQNQLDQLNTDSRVTILTESISNLSNFQFVNCIDRTLALVDYKDQDMQPDLVITVGEAIISKKIKSYLRNIKGLTHWNIHSNATEVDTFKCLESVINCEVSQFFRAIISVFQPTVDSSFSSKWLSASLLALDEHIKFTGQVRWSDLKVFTILQDTFPENINLHLGNSSVVRYHQLFNPIKSIRVFGNRGVSGIDGSTSTSIGIATESKGKLNVLVSGDLSFMYDANAFWNTIQLDNFKVIVINNNGGGIFGIIPGPESTGIQKSHFEVGNNSSIEKLCAAHNLDYLSASNEAELENELYKFYNSESNTPVVLEVVTPSEVNSDVLKAYFNTISSSH
jgi:2-succinyl-5-enolpyruvyl-6-hydroxy-3-cyclohexene-1-carboxylate synthase